MYILEDRCVNTVEQSPQNCNNIQNTCSQYFLGFVPPSHLTFCLAFNSTLGMITENYL